MEKIDYKQIAFSYRNNLIEYGKRVPLENPDRLSRDELEALTVRIFDELNRLDMAMGFEYHDVGIKRPASVSKEDQEALFTDFLDWYGVIKTPSIDVLQFTSKRYPNTKYKNILCVGDGENCHLGRKLASRGYDVLSVDPLANKVFSGNYGNGKLRILKEFFSKDSEDMIDWADVIVGSKVPMCAEDLIQLPKPTVFTISGNPEMYNMRFKGVPIKSEEQLQEEIRKCSGVRAFQSTASEWDKIRQTVIFLRDEKQKEKGERQ